MAPATAFSSAGMSSTAYVFVYTLYSGDCSLGKHYSIILRTSPRILTAVVQRRAPGDARTYFGVGRRANNFATPQTDPPQCLTPPFKDGRGVTTKWWGKGGAGGVPRRRKIAYLIHISDVI